jgi:four helix bundle protein
MKTENKILELTFDFSPSIIELYKVLVEKKEFVISKQLLRSGTSIGANVEEATAAQTKKEFITKMSIASKEARETGYWLRLLDKSKLVASDYAPYLLQINHIINILTKIVKTSQDNMLNVK